VGISQIFHTPFFVCKLEGIGGFRTAKKYMLAEIAGNIYKECMASLVRHDTLEKLILAIYIMLLFFPNQMLQSTTPIFAS
jgi:hypothetical protein